MEVLSLPATTREVERASFTSAISVGVQTRRAGQGHVPHVAGDVVRVLLDVGDAESAGAVEGGIDAEDAFLVTVGRVDVDGVY
jgi:hypothetical protein